MVACGAHPPVRHGGRKRSVNVREVLNGIFYILWTGYQWKALPKDLPPKSTVHDYLELWNWDGTLERIHHALYVAVREQAGVWSVFTLMLIVFGPFILHRWRLARSALKPDATFRHLEWLHRILLFISLITVLGAVLGSYGQLLFQSP